MKVLIIDDEDEVVAEIEFGESVKKTSRTIKKHPVHDSPAGEEFRDRVRKAIKDVKEKEEAEREQRLYEEWKKKWDSNGGFSTYDNPDP